MKGSLLLLALFCASAHAVRDDYGNEIHLEKPAARIVSLAPHLTELLYDAGAGAKVVGAVEYSDFPPAARALPRVGNDAVIDLEAVLALRPDLVVAWPSAGSRAAVDRLSELGLPVFRSEPRELEDIATTLARLGELAGTQSVARRAAADFRSRIAALGARYSGRPPVRVFYEVWDRPLQTVSGEHVISKVIRLCGGENVFADLPGIAPLIDAEAVLRANPEVIVAGDAQAHERTALERWKAFPGIRAVAAGQVHSIPPDLIERHTPRIAEGAERLCGWFEGARSAR